MVGDDDGVADGVEVADCESDDVSDIDTETVIEGVRLGLGVGDADAVGVTV